MRIISTAIILGITLLIVPVISYFFGRSLGEVEWDALYTLIIICASVIAITFIVGEITSNNSQVDKIWSLIPIAYVWVVADYGDYSPRLILMAVLVTIWGLRLTANFALKGAYEWKIWAGEEDYRWQVLRQKPEFSPRWKWTLFNLFFICGYQNILILLFSLPVIIALQYNNNPLGSFDYIAGGVMLLFIIYETVADIQHWKYQSMKHRMIHQGQELTGDFEKGFLDKGLWSVSRHPNYFAEQAIWICFYLFSIAAGAQWFNWSVAGCLLLIVLFRGSSNFSEEISARKYPEYKNYQKKVARFIPFLRIS